METTRDKSTDLAYARDKFIEAGGSTTLSFGLGRLVGQIYALLYLSPEPMCLDDIAHQLGVSKAGVSVTIRQMEQWHAVRHIWVKGDRRDYYECEPDLQVILKTGVLGTLRKKLETAGGQLDHVEQLLLAAASKSSDSGKISLTTVAGRLQKARSFHKKMTRLIDNPVVKHLL